MNKTKSKKCCASRHDREVSYQIEAVITIDERGQMVLPKETRARAGIRGRRQAGFGGLAERGPGVLPFPGEGGRNHRDSWRIC